MKKKSGLFLLVALMAVLVVGCGNGKGSEGKKGSVSNKDVEEAFKTAATSYYTSYQRGVIGQDYNEITLEMLENVNKNANAGYDLSKLSGCTKDSKVTIQADENRDIVDYKFELNCK